jgi:hypothetical protein
MPTPLALSNEEIDLLYRLASPIAFNRRDEFLQAVADALASCPEPGPDVTHRVARQIQKSFTLQAQRETEIGDRPRHLRARASVQV